MVVKKLVKNPLSKKPISTAPGRMMSITIDEASLLTDEQIYSFLKDQWNIPGSDEIEIIGTLTAEEVNAEKNGKKTKKWIYTIHNIKEEKNYDKNQEYNENATGSFVHICQAKFNTDLIFVIHTLVFFK